MSWIWYLLGNISIFTLVILSISVVIPVLIVCYTVIGSFVNRLYQVPWNILVSIFFTIKGFLNDELSWKLKLKLWLLHKNMEFFRHIWKYVKSFHISADEYSVLQLMIRVFIFRSGKSLSLLSSISRTNEKSRNEYPVKKESKTNSSTLTSYGNVASIVFITWTSAQSLTIRRYL